MSNAAFLIRKAQTFKERAIKGILQTQVIPNQETGLCFILVTNHSYITCRRSRLVFRDLVTCKNISLVCEEAVSFCLLQGTETHWINENFREGKVYLSYDQSHKPSPFMMNLLVLPNTYRDLKATLPTWWAQMHFRLMLLVKIWVF